jgi:hypothetical protein
MRARGTCVVATLVAMTFVVAGTVDAKGYDEDTLDFGFFYDDLAAGYVATAGVPIEDFCLDAPAEADLRVFSRRDGTATLKSRGQRDVAIYLYEFAGPAPALVEVACEAIFDGDPATEPPVALATGSGLLKVTVVGIEGPEDIGGYSMFNSINGIVTATDGAQWKVRAHADFDLDDDGVPIGDPSEFQGLDVQRIRLGR